MTTLFFIILPIYVIISFALKYFIDRKINLDTKAYDDLYKALVKAFMEQEKKIDYVSRKIDAMSDDFDRSLVDLRESLKKAEPISTIKPNNWDSIKEAFTPMRPRSKTDV